MNITYFFYVISPRLCDLTRSVFKMTCHAIQNFLFCPSQDYIETSTWSQILNGYATELVASGGQSDRASLGALGHLLIDIGIFSLFKSKSVSRRSEEGWVIEYEARSLSQSTDWWTLPTSKATEQPAKSHVNGVKTVTIVSLLQVDQKFMPHLRHLVFLPVPNWKPDWCCLLGQKIAKQKRMGPESQYSVLLWEMTKYIDIGWSY